MNTLNLSKFYDKNFIVIDSPHLIGRTMLSKGSKFSQEEDRVLNSHNFEYEEMRTGVSWVDNGFFSTINTNTIHNYTYNLDKK